MTGAAPGSASPPPSATARLGATVHLVVRDLAKGRAAVTEIRGEVPGAEVLLHRCDVSDLSSVRAFAAALRGSVDAVDVLVHNAGVLPPERQETGDGHEVTLATHVLGPLLMTELLRPLLAAAGAGAGGAGDLGRDVRPDAAGPTTRSTAQGAYSGDDRVRAHQADAGRAGPADAGALGRRRDRRAHHAPRAGPTPRAWSTSLPGLPQGDGAAAARPRERRGHHRLAGRDRARSRRRPALARPGAPARPLPGRSTASTPATRTGPGPTCSTPPASPDPLRRVGANAGLLVVESARTHVSHPSSRRERTCGAAPLPAFAPTRRGSSERSRRLDRVHTCVRADSAGLGGGQRASSSSQSAPSRTGDRSSACSASRASPRVAAPRGPRRTPRP